MNTVIDTPASAPDKVLAYKLRMLAAGMQAQIDDKLRTGRLTNTRKRASEAERMEREGRRLQQVQRALGGLADLWEAGQVPPALAGIRAKQTVADLLTYEAYPRGDYEWSLDMRVKLIRSGLTADNYQDARARILELAAEQVSEEEARRRQAAQLERDLVGMKIPGFFPTPQWIAEEMVAYADIHDQHLVLEPSAGKGDIAEVIRELHPEAALEVVEINHALRQILFLKGFDLKLMANFLDFQGGPYDRIVMNPPFEDGQDMQHVRHAFELLVRGGRLVSIMSPSYTYSGKGSAVAFREWLEELGADEIELPAGSFKESGTGVNARMVVIDKP